MPPWMWAAHDPQVAMGAPGPDTPDYGHAVLEYLRRVAPDDFDGLPVRFFSTFANTVAGSELLTSPSGAALVNLEVWGFPTSLPAHDPTNRQFVYQRFQRGIMHYDAATGVTKGILLADYFKSVLTGQSLPPDLFAQAAASPLLGQYCRGGPQWVCRPQQISGTDLIGAFEQQ